MTTNREKRNFESPRIIGCKLCLVLNKFGLVVDWDCDTANVHDNTFQAIIQQFEDEMIVFGDSGFHSKEGDPQNLKICKRGTWNDRMLVETVLSMLTVVSHFKKMTHRKWDYLKSRIATTWQPSIFWFNGLGCLLMDRVCSLVYQ